MIQPFSAVALQDAYDALFITSLQAQMQAQTLEHQPPVTLNAVPSLPDDILVAQAAAGTELRVVEPDLLHCVASGIGYENLFLSMYDKLLSLATAIDQGGSARAAAQDEFVEGIGLLTGQIRLLQPGLSKLGKDSNQLQSDAQSAASALAADAAAATTDPDVIALQAQITAAQDALTADCTTIANSMKGTVKGEIKLAIAMFNCEDDKKGAVKAFVGFILDTAHKEEGVQAALADEKKQLTSLASLYAQLAVLEFTVAVVQTLASTSALFASAAAEQSAASGQLTAAWQTLLDGLTQLSTAVASGEALPEPIAPALAAQQDGWCLLGSGLSSWQLSGSLSVTVIPYQT